ncbi:molybdopterin molybdenumtransferase MoeA [Actinomycetes bacterium]|nr:molybdopterin molybdenumtransferase MoeA [Actinomycetes bacterium]
MIPLHEAQETVLAGCAPLTPQQVAYTEMTGRVLDQDVVAVEDVPPFRNTAVDGYAVRAIDTEQVPVELVVVDTLAAGAEPKVAVNAGEAIRIMTGAPMPNGADAVVMVEDTERVGETHVRISRSAKVRDGVRDAGSDVRAGETVFVRGTVLNAAGIGVLASVNARIVRAFPRARVALLSTGDELVVDGSPLRIGQIRESNLTMLHSMIAATGCEVINLGVVRDDEAKLERVLLEVIERCDAIVTSGGVSMGDFDVVKAVLSKIATMQWMQMAIKPAKPFAFGQLQSSDGRTIPIFGLPGNPVSSLISYELLARPALRKMMGHTDNLMRPAIRAVLDSPLKRKPDGKIHFMRVFGEFAEDGRLHVRDSGPQGSHQLASTAMANGLAHVPDGSGLQAGEHVSVYLLG